ncbi:MAG: outer membrane beta-barrel protein [Candidatus Eisenbacteria bacterium]|nr:outer membrane beta-barrel protein [Candidatus Eisenbacteria bacterium]
MQRGNEDGKTKPGGTMLRPHRTPHVLAGLLFCMLFGLLTTASAKIRVMEELDIAELAEAPTIRLGYGLCDVTLDGLETDFAELGQAELALGYSDYELNENGITDYTYGALSFARLSTELSEQAEAGTIDGEFWRIGFDGASGYGYRIRGSAITPYYGWGLNATQLTVDAPLDRRTDQALIDLYRDEFRFGSKMEGGLRLRFGPMVELSAGYERTAVFRRWLFWKWLLSAGLEHTAQEALDAFIEEIHDRSPKAAPLVHFVLKNALAYAWYELRTEEMNWPFDTEPALMLETYKVGISFIF